MTCSNCSFYTSEWVTSPFSGRRERVLLCTAEEDDECPMELALLIEAMETVVPCVRCGQDCDGHGVIDGIPVCPACDKGVL